MSNHLLILDIDETLVYSAESRLSRAEDFRVGPFWVYKRPHVDEFLRIVADWFDLAVWTSSGSGYAAATITRLIGGCDKLQFLWSAERCTPTLDPETREEIRIKDFKKLKRAGYSLGRVLVIDDSPEKHSRNYGNLIRIRPYEGADSDSELRDLLPFLDWIRTCDDVRKIEKRTWRSFRPQ